MGLPKQLSEQQKKFAELLVYNEGRKTPTECALEAGYAEGSAHVRASELRNPNKYPLVVKYIGEIRKAKRCPRFNTCPDNVWCIFLNFLPEF